jgi:hypothetical protein
MFLFLAAVVAVFAFLNIAAWAPGPAHERLLRDRLALLKTLAEQPGENAARVLEMLSEEDQRWTERKERVRRRGLIIGDLTAAASGVGPGVSGGMRARGCGSAHGRKRDPQTLI